MIWPRDVALVQGTSLLRIRLDLEVNTMKNYSTSPEVESHHQMLFTVIIRTFPFLAGRESDSYAKNTVSIFYASSTGEGSKFKDHKQILVIHQVILFAVLYPFLILLIRRTICAYFMCGSFCGVKGKMLNINLEVDECELLSSYYVHFRTNALWEKEEPPNLLFNNELNSIIAVILQGWLWH